MNITLNLATDYVSRGPPVATSTTSRARASMSTATARASPASAARKLRFRERRRRLLPGHGQEVEAALIALDTIQALESQGVTGVNVSDWSPDMAAPYSEYAHAVEFRGSASAATSRPCRSPRTS